MTDLEIRNMARRAADCLIDQRPFNFPRADGESLPGFPLPIKKMPADANGLRWQDYRPLAILEYCNDFLSGEIAKREARERKAAKEKEAAP